ncbi:MAG: Hsp70 family protein [Actinomycetota bacterium]
MSAYALGVDLGTTYSAAAIARGATAEPVPLGTDAAQIPSIVLVRDDGEVLVGDAAERRASAEPTRAAREFKRRLGDPVPVVIGETTHTVESLMGHLLREIVRRATEQEGEPPTVVVLTHPANYSEYKTGTLREAARLAGLDADHVVLLTEPEAAAIAYARQQRIEPGEIVAVYDFGGGTFDAALVRRTADRFELVGVPEGMERLGGIDFDQAVMAHVDASLGGLVSGADRNDPQTRPGQARLRAECRRAKEALSTDSDTSIPVTLPGVHTEVRLTRDEFESMIRPRIGETVQALERAVSSAHVGMDQIARVLLVGGTSRMPIVAELVRAATGRPVSLDAHPKLAIAVGASLAGAASIPQTAATATAATPAWQPPVRPAETAVDSPPPTKAPRSGRRVGVIAATVGVGIGVAAVVAAVALGGGADGEQAGTATTAVTSTATSPSVEPSPTTGGTTGGTTTGTADTSPPTTAGASTVPSTPPGRGLDAIVDRIAFGEAAGGSGIPGPALAAGVSGITAIAVDGQGSVYVATVEATVLRIINGEVSLVAPLDPAEGAAGGIVVAPDGSVLVSTAAGVRSLRDGASTLLLDAAAAGLGATPGPLALDGVGNLYVADNDTHRIIRRGTDGSLSLIAGTGVVASPGPLAGEGQPASSVALGTVTGLAVDGAGNLLVADTGVLALRAIAPAGTITTLVGGGPTPLGGSDGLWVADGTPGRDVALGGLDGLAVDAAGRAYIADTTSGAILRLGTDGTIDIVITRRTDVAPVDGVPVDGVPARESSVAAVGALAADRAGALYFEDGAILRAISGI